MVRKKKVYRCCEAAEDRLLRLGRSVERYAALLRLHAPSVILQNELRLMQIHALAAWSDEDAAGKPTVSDE